MASASSSNNSCDNSCGSNKNQVVARVDNEPIIEPRCDDYMTPKLDFGEDCDNVLVTLQTQGQGYIRAKDVVRASVKVVEPLTVGADGKSIEFGKLPWPAVTGDGANPEPAPSISAADGETFGLGFWSDRPGEHPLIDAGRAAWPVDGDGIAVEEDPYNNAVGTYANRTGHPVIHKPQTEADCVFSTAFSFSNSASGSLPLTPSTPLQIPFFNTDCRCTKIVKLDLLFEYNVQNLQSSGSGVSLAFRGNASNNGLGSKSWTFNQERYSSLTNMIKTGNSSYIVSIAPKTSTTVSIWPEVALGLGETVQPSQYNIVTKVEACYSTHFSC